MQNGRIPLGEDFILDGSRSSIRVADEIKIKLIQFTTLQSLKEAAGNRHVWWLKFDRNDRWEEGQYCV